MKLWIFLIKFALNRLFNYIDKDKNGQLDAQELKNLSQNLKNLSQKLNKLYKIKVK